MNERFARRLVLTAAAPVSALVIAIVLSTLVLLISGSNPISAYLDMLEHGSKLETQVDILNRATPLYLAGVAVAIGFRMNLLNIGVEGQYLLAFIVAAHLGAQVELPPVLHIAYVLVIAMAVGGAFAGLAGVLKVTRGVNEVISTIMLNSVVISGLAAWWIVEWQAGGEISATGGRVGTEPIDESRLMPDINSWLEAFTREVKFGKELTGMLVVAVVVGVLYHVLLTRTVLGFDLRSSGANQQASHVGGISPKRMIVIAIVLSGVVAGLVGMPELMDAGYYPSNPISLLGFWGIAVALLGRNHPAGVAVAALIFAFLDISSGILQVTGAASREIVEIMKGLIILTAVIAYAVVNRIRARDEAAAAAAAMADPPAPPRTPPAPAEMPV
ncbi:MAG: ABC transporter permease [Acidimicrobiaceae bacterium]|nr:ABC transporter permease [Acidimicrobiaceae bacterium]MCY4176572.1 ABC transporter permease [Acidimicrobiaceae bacterium]MCY4279312.1 ABC transporter permease [Acidimicrobiaceae bacterium]MCY4294690.1 ABC transporter permease [Acidimicrobiaceae bacterium]